MMAVELRPTVRKSEKAQAHALIIGNCSWLLLFITVDGLVQGQQ